MKWIKHVGKLLTAYVPNPIFPICLLYILVMPWLRKQGIGTISRNDKTILFFRIFYNLLSLCNENIKQYSLNYFVVHTIIFFFFELFIGILAFMWSRLVTCCHVTVLSQNLKFDGFSVLNFLLSS